MPKLKRREAEHEAETERSWECETCPTMIEEGAEDSRFCRQCRMYWDDVKAGMFDEKITEPGR